MPVAQRHSEKREAILSALRMTSAHPSAEWIYLQLKPRFPNISLGTVYRNLSQFKEQGLIQSVATVKGVERFDANVTPHVHFICRQCGSVTDLPHMRVAPELCRDAARESGARVEQCWLTFYGDCNTCHSMENQS